MTKQELYRKTNELCSSLIQAKSNSGEENRVAEVLAKAFRELGYDEITVDEYGSVIGCIHGKRAGSRVLLDGHIDTVPVDHPKQWRDDPYSGRILEDRIYGRGASDMKGAVAAMACAAAFYAEQCGRDFPGDIYVAGVVYEELYEGIAARKISEFVKPDFVIIGEASELNLKIGQRGRAEIMLETQGVSAHSANPEKGINAVTKMVHLLSALEGLRPAEQSGLGKGILEVTDIKSSPYPGASVVPDRCVVTMDRRLLVGDTKDSVLSPIQEVIDRIRSGDENFRAAVSIRSETKTCYTGNSIDAERFFPGWLFDREEPFLLNAYESLKQIGQSPSITTYSFCTNGSHYAGEKGIRTLGFGPSRENLAHTLDEYVLLDQLEKAADGYAAILGALLVNTHAE